MEIDPSGLSLADRYKFLIGVIVPRPIAFVSTISPDGRPNLAPFSFYAGVAAEPMTLLFCPANKPDGTEKDTLRNVQLAPDGGTGEFVVNAAIEPYARKVAAAAEPLPYGESEYEHVGLTTAPAHVVKPPRVAESPVAFECRTLQIIRLAPGRPSGGNIVIGRIVHVFVRDGLIDDRLRTDPDKLSAIGRMGGLHYCRTHDRFEMPMGLEALQG